MTHTLLLDDMPRVYLLFDLTHLYAMDPQGDVTHIYLLCDVTHVYLVCDMTHFYE